MQWRPFHTDASAVRNHHTELKVLTFLFLTFSFSLRYILFETLRKLKIAHNFSLKFVNITSAKFREQVQTYLFSFFDMPHSEMPLLLSCKGLATSPLLKSPSLRIHNYYFLFLLPLSSLSWKCQQDKLGMMVSSAFTRIKLIENMWLAEAKLSNYGISAHFIIYMIKSS